MSFQNSLEFPPCVNENHKRTWWLWSKCSFHLDKVQHHSEIYRLLNVLSIGFTTNKRFCITKKNKKKQAAFKKRFKFSQWHHTKCTHSKRPESWAKRNLQHLDKQVGLQQYRHRQSVCACLLPEGLSLHSIKQFYTLFYLRGNTTG